MSWYCWLYLFLAFIFIASSLHFFEIQERTTTVTAAQSRNMNQECTLMMFDAHDIWHFLSAWGILFTLLTVLTIEDNNTNTPWSKLHVFWKRFESIDCLSLSFDLNIIFCFDLLKSKPKKPIFIWAKQKLTEKDKTKKSLNFTIQNYLIPNINCLTIFSA